jgi:hypothetical protein
LNTADIEFCRGENTFFINVKSQIKGDNSALLGDKPQEGESDDEGRAGSACAMADESSPARSRHHTECFANVSIFRDFSEELLQVEGSL